MFIRKIQSNCFNIRLKLLPGFMEIAKNLINNNTIKKNKLKSF